MSGDLGPTLQRQVDPRQRTPPAARGASGSGHGTNHDYYSEEVLQAIQVLQGMGLQGMGLPERASVE
jgi:hypothetical protein